MSICLSVFHRCVQTASNALNLQPKCPKETNHQPKTCINHLAPPCSMKRPMLNDAISQGKQNESMTSHVCTQLPSFSLPSTPRPAVHPSTTLWHRNGWAGLHHPSHSPSS